MALGVFVGCCLSWGLFFLRMPLGGFWLLLVLGFVSYACPQVFVVVACLGCCFFCEGPELFLFFACLGSFVFVNVIGFLLFLLVLGAVFDEWP